MSSIIQGDCLDRLKDLPSDSVDVVITDPPYGYSFMGKDWDKAVPSVEIWQECLRVLKPGAFACVMSAPRSDVQQAMTERLIRAGFRLDFTPIYWTYASGFPKAGNIGKLVDKRLGAKRATDYIPRRDNEVFSNGKGKAAGVDRTAGAILSSPASTPQAKVLDGSYAGFQPKPAVEVVIIAMKPLSEKTYVDQALKNGHGVSWLDDGRIPTGGEASTNGIIEICQCHPSDSYVNNAEQSKPQREATSEVRKTYSVLESVATPSLEKIHGTAQGDTSTTLQAMSCLDEILAVNTTASSSMSGSGSENAEQSLKDTKSTISTETRQTTESRTCNVCYLPLIDGSIQKATNSAKAGTTGRFPANLIVSDDVLNDGRVTKSSDRPRNNTQGDTMDVYGDYQPVQSSGFADSGSYSRYFDLDKWARERLPAEQAMTFPFAIFPKASKSEKNKGLEHIEPKYGMLSNSQKAQLKRGDEVVSNLNHASKSHNSHPTVKPLKLMSYLVTLFSRPGDTVLDPFVGSGTTVVAAEQLGRVGIGIEREAGYAEIARARLAHIMPLPEEPESVPPVTMDEVLQSKPAKKTKPDQLSLF